MTLTEAWHGKGPMRSMGVWIWCDARGTMYAFCRYAASLVLVVYGCAKLTGAQFTVLSSELDKPMGDVSGFWLTWHYFSFSPIFGTSIAVAQIILGVLLCWRKTTLTRVFRAITC
jgi:hypothetical protein